MLLSREPGPNIKTVEPFIYSVILLEPSASLCYIHYTLLPVFASCCADSKPHSCDTRSYGICIVYLTSASTCCCSLSCTPLLISTHASCNGGCELCSRHHRSQNSFCHRQYYDDASVYTPLLLPSSASCSANCEPDSSSVAPYTMLLGGMARPAHVVSDSYSR